MEKGNDIQRVDISDQTIRNFMRRNDCALNRGNKIKKTVGDLETKEVEGI